MGKTKRILAIMLTLALLLTQLPAVLSAEDGLSVPEPGLALISAAAQEPDGISVMIEGKNVEFADQQPVLVGEQVLAPAAEIFAALNAKVTWNEAETGGAAAFPNGVSVEFSLVSDGRIYLRRVCEAAGYQVTWNSFFNRVTVRDVQALIDEIDSRFHIVNSLMKTSQEAQDPDQVYEVNFSGGGSAVPYEQGEELKPFSVSGKLTGAVRGLDLALDGQASVDFGFLTELLLGAAPDESADADLVAAYEEQSALLEKLKDIDLSMIANSEENTFYLKSAFLAALDPELEIDENTWYLTDYNSGDYLEMMNEIYGLTAQEMEDLTVGKIMVDFADIAAYPAEELEMTIDFLDMFMGDEYMKQTFDHGTATYVVEYDKASFAQMLAHRYLIDNKGIGDFDMTEALEAWETVDTFDYRLEFRQVGDKVTFSGFDFAVKVDDGEDAVDIRYYVEATETAAKGGFSIDMDTLGKLAIDFDCAQKASSVTVPSAPPADEKVLDMR